MERNRLEAYVRRFLWVVLAVCAVALVWAPEPARGAYDGTLPADNSKIASGPAMIRENMRALKDDGIVNAGRLASYTLPQVAGEFFSCVASTTSTAMLNASGTHLNVGTATGTYTVFFLGGGEGPVGSNYASYGVHQFYTVHVATTTELVGSVVNLYFPQKSPVDTSLWRVGIATSAVRGEIGQTASGPVNAFWHGRVWVNGPSW